MTLRDEYKAAGWALCDIPLGTKGPTTKGWNIRGAVAHGQQGLGLCHAYSGTCAVDVDDYVLALEWLESKGVDLDSLLDDPRSVQIISGKVNRAKLLYKLPTPLASLSLAPYQKISPKTGKMQTYHALELRCATRDEFTVQDVLPPTVHPETLRPYTWAYGDDQFGHWSNLPELPSAILALWKAEQVSLPSQQAAPAETKGASLAEIVELLKFKDPNNCAYDDWLKVGIGLAHETQNSEAGYQLWCEWSARCPKHDTTHMPAKWRSFKPDAKNPITLGSLRRERVADPAQFAVVTAQDTGEDTRPETAAKELLESRLVFVTAHESYFDLQSSVLLGNVGIEHIFCPQMPVVKVPGKSGKADKMVQQNPVQWLKHSKTKRIVDQVGMHPGAGRLYTEDSISFVNFFVPAVVEDLVPLAHEKEAFNFLWSRMKDPVFQSWLLKFFAFMLQKPGAKIQSAPLLVSAAQGTGKNTILKIIPEILFGSRYVRTMSGSVLGGQFNGAIGQTWWLYLEELRAGSNKVDRQHTTNKVKSWITDNTLEVHKKGLEAYEIRNRVQIGGTSNFDDALQLDNNDRRWGIGAMHGPLSAAESMDLYGFLLSERAPGVLRYIFRRVDVSNFKPGARAPETLAKREMIAAGIGSWESKLVEAMVAQESPFDRDIFPLKAVEEFMMGQGITPHALGRILRRAPFDCLLLPNGRKHRLWAWRNQGIWAAATESERLQHIQTGVRPEGCSTRIPASILVMSADAGVDSNTDLLG